MTQAERPIIDRVWEFTKDISVKVSTQAEKHWKINTLRVQIASIKHKKNNSCKELGKFVYESLLSKTVEEESYKTSLEGFFVELENLDAEILEREQRIETLAEEPDFNSEEEDTVVTENETSETINAEPVEPADSTDSPKENESEDTEKVASDKQEEKSE